MARIEIYSSPFCAYCSSAKALLDQKGSAYEEIDIMAQPARREEMLKRSGGRQTVPQIFINDQHIGGFDDMKALDRQGGLDPLLGKAA